MELVLIVIRRFSYLTISVYMIFNIPSYRYNHIDNALTVTYKS